ncbi:30S ribosomal protein S2 [Candidatus Micrarchaeota archaeon]|nr:30S ribosomal protein S2 [Candidatus Micrarchaeota archaeon]
MEEKVEEKKESMLLPQERYLEAGIHIGTRMKTIDMKNFIFKKRDDGLYILDLRKIDKRIRLAAKLLKKYKPEDIVIVASRTYSANAATKFSKLTGVPVLKGRFRPGLFTNTSLKGFMEPKIVFVCDPKGEANAVREASRVGTPVIALCDTDNLTKFIDFVIPVNNKGRKALATIFYLLTRELMLAQGKIKSYDEFEYRIGYFEKFEIATEEKKEEPKEEPVIEEEPKEKPAKKQEEKEKEVIEELKQEKEKKQKKKTTRKKTTKKPAKKTEKKTTKKKSSS